VSNISQIDPNFKVESQLKEEGIRFYDVKQPPFRIYGVFYEDGKFRRLPENVAKSVSEEVHRLHAKTAGGRVRFRTDSPYVAIQAKMPKITRTSHCALSGLAGFDMYTSDGEERYVKTFMPPYDMVDGYEAAITFENPGMHEVTIHFPLYSEVSELYIGLHKDAFVGEGKTYKPGKPIVYYGSSITQGGCASRPGNAYESIISRRLHVDHINLGFSGSARAEDEIANYIAHMDMSVFVYDYDHNARTAEYLQKTHEKMFRIIRDAHPNLPIVMMSMPKYYLTEPEEARRAVIETTYRNALQKGDRNVYFLDGKALMAMAGDEGTVDNCHPTDLGFMSMAKTLGDLLAEILKRIDTL